MLGRVIYLEHTHILYGGLLDSLHQSLVQLLQKDEDHRPWSLFTLTVAMALVSFLPLTAASSALTRG